MRKLSQVLEKLKFGFGAVALVNFTFGYGHKIIYGTLPPNTPVEGSANGYPWLLYPISLSVIALLFWMFETGIRTPGSAVSDAAIADKANREAESKGTAA